MKQIIVRNLKKQRRILWFLVLVATTSASVWYLNIWSISLRDEIVPAKNVDYTLVRTPVCKFPLLDYNHPFAADVAKIGEPLSCSDNVPALILHNKFTSLTYFPELVTVYGKSVNCTYVPLHRYNDYVTSWDKGIKFITTKEVEVQDEFIQVECLNKDEELVFEEFFSFIQRKPNVEERCKKIHKEYPGSKNKLSVLILLIDSVSRNHFLRHMKKTNEYLQNFATLIDMKGFNIISNKVFVSHLALLTGRSFSDFNLTSNSTVDSLPFIWKDFASKGYRVLYSEDAASKGIFNSYTKGFNDPPTDYYYRPFTIAYHDKMLTYSSNAGCIKTQRKAEVILKWVRHFFQTFSPDPLFALVFLSELSTNSMGTLYQYDSDVLNFFKLLKDNNYLDQTIVFFMSDHGFQKETSFSSYILRTESKLPLLFVLLPSWFSSTYPDLIMNLKTNANRLITVFDLHATLKDILNFPEIHSQSDDSDQSRVSLLRRVVSENRTCDDALIPERYCACHVEQEVPAYNHRISEAALKIVKVINKITWKWRSKCFRLSLHSVKNATYEALAGDEHHMISFYYRIILQTKPGKGIFKGEVWYRHDAKSYTADPHVQRIDSYEFEEDCISDYLIKPFCHCRYKYLLF